MHLYNRLLPPELFQQIFSSEVQRFSELVRSLSETWQSSIRGPNGGGTLKFVPIINTFLDSKSEFDISDVSLLIKISYEIFFHYCDELFVQIRWGKILISVLQKYKVTNPSLKFTLNWRPFYECLRTTHFSTPQNFLGPLLLQNHRAVLLQLIKCSRNYFSVSSLEEIWNEFSPSFSELSSDKCLESIGFLSLLFPSPKNASNDYYDFVNKHIPIWFDLWSRIQFCSFWDERWLSLIGRTVKVSPLTQLSSDVTSKYANTWQQLLVSRVLNTFALPVGKSQGSIPNGMSRATPKSVSVFLSEPEHFFMKKTVSAARYSAKVFVHSFDFSDSETKEYVFLKSFLNLINLIQDFYHPSNSGPWMDQLESFLKYSSHYFFKRVFNDSLPPLDDEIKQKTTKSLLCLIEKSQFSKSSSMASVSSKSLFLLSYILPELVLPHVIYTFNISISTETATHQLKNSLLSLSLCTRPMFLFSKNLSESNFSNFGQDTQDFVLQNFFNDKMNFDPRKFFSFVLTETLPGIDYNDPQKTLSVFRLYLSLFSCIGKIDDGMFDENDKNYFPLDWSQWMDEFLMRIITIFGHIEAPSIDLKNSNSFLNDDELMSAFSPLIKLFFSRLNDSLSEQGYQKVANFVANDFFPNAKNEISSFLHSIACANPTSCCRFILRPLLNKLLILFEDANKGISEIELPLLQEYTYSTKDIPISAYLEDSLSYYICMLGSMIPCMGNLILNYKIEINKIISLGFRISSEKVNEETFELLCNIFRSLLLSYPTNTFKFFEYSNPHADTEKWFGKFPNTNKQDAIELTNFISWHAATSDEILFAQSLVHTHFENVLIDIQFLTSSEFYERKIDKVTERKLWRISLLRIQACLFGLKCALSDFESSNPTPNQSQTQVEKFSGSEYFFSICGYPGNYIFDGKLKNKLAKILGSVCSHFLSSKSDDLKILSLLISIIDPILNHGSIDYDEWRKGQKVLHIQKNYFSEPRLNRSIGKRRPAWLLLSLLESHAIWRNSQFQYRAAKSFFSNYLLLPEEILTLANYTYEFSLNKYKKVRSGAKSVFDKTIKRFPTLTDHYLQKISEKICVANENNQAVLIDEDVFISFNEIFTSRSMNRRLSQDWFALKVFIFSLLNSSNLETQKAQSSISETLVQYLLRFSGIPRMYGNNNNRSEKHENAQREIIQKLSSTISDENSYHWRYILMANIFSYFLIPSQNDSHILNLFHHFLKNTVSEIPVLRPFSTHCLINLLTSTSTSNYYFSPYPSTNSWIITFEENTFATQKRLLSSNEKIQEHSNTVDEDENQRKSKIESVIVEVFSSNFCLNFVKKIANDHKTEKSRVNAMLSFAGSMFSRRKNSDASSDMSMVIVDLISQSMERSQFSRTAKSFDGRTSSATIFDIRNALLFEKLCDFSQSKVMDVLISEFQTFSSKENVAEDRNMDACCAEIVSGILTSNSKQKIDFWNQDLKDITWKLMLKADVDATEDWRTFVRHVVSRRRQKQEENMSSVNQSAGNVLFGDSELSGSVPDRENFKAEATKTDSKFEKGTKGNEIDSLELLRDMMVDGYKTVTSASHIAKILGYLGVFFSELSVAVFGLFEIQLFEFLFLETRKLMFHPSQQVREEVAILLSIFMEKVFDNSSKIQEQYFNDWKHLQSSVFSFFSVFGKACEKFSSALISNDSKDGYFALNQIDEPSISELLDQNLINSESDLWEKVNFWMQTVCHFLIVSMKNGSAVYFQNQISEILPSILLLQEVWDKDFALLTKQACAYLKFIYIRDSSILPNFIQSFQISSKINIWHSRMALLSYLQSFVFRNISFFDDPNLETVRKIVLEFLKSDRIEVREQSLSAVSVLIKSDEVWANKFRNQILQIAENARRKRKSFSKNTMFTSEKNEELNLTNVNHRHYIILSLSAFILSFPFDIPDWMPDLLMSLSAFSHDPSSSIKLSISKTFSEFKKTHADAWQIHERQFTPQQLEILKELTSAQSYFV